MYLSGDDEDAQSRQLHQRRQKRGGKGSQQTAALHNLTEQAVRTPPYHQEYEKEGEAPPDRRRSLPCRRLSLPCRRPSLNGRPGASGSAGDKLDDGVDGEDEGQEYDAAFSTHEVGKDARGERADDAAQGEDGGDPA